MEQPHHPAAERDKVENRVELPNAGSQDSGGEVWGLEQAVLVVTSSNDRCAVGVITMVRVSKWLPEN